MTARLPDTGSDGDVWGDILNEFLSVAHNSDGSIIPTWQNSVGFNLNGGGHDAIAANLDLVKVNQYGNFMLGQNKLINSDNPPTFHSLVSDFYFSQASLRLFLRSLTMTEVDDPPDLTFTRFGGGFPYAGGNNTTLTGGSDGGTIVGQVKTVPSSVPFNGDMTTQGSTAQTQSASMDFVTTERVRDLTGNQDYAVGTAIRFTTSKQGRETPDATFQVNDDGGVRVGRSAIADSATTPPLAFLRGDSGVNQKVQISITGTPTGGTFSLTDFGAVPASPGFITGAGQTTSGIAFNATAAAVQTAIEALSSVGSGQTTVTGGPLPGTPITVEFSGSGVSRRNRIRLQPASSLTGGSSPLAHTVITVDGTPDMLATRMLHIVHGGQTGDVPTADYITIQTPGRASIIFRVEPDGTLQIIPDGTNTKFVAGQTGIGFFSATQKAQQGAVANTHTVTAGSTTAVFTNTSFDGSSGSTAYTIGDIVKALKAYGLLAS